MKKYVVLLCYVVCVFYGLSSFGLKNDQYTNAVKFANHLDSDVTVKCDDQLIVIPAADYGIISSKNIGDKQEVSCTINNKNSVMQSNKDGNDDATFSMWLSFDRGWYIDSVEFTQLDENKFSITLGNMIVEEENPIAFDSTSNHEFTIDNAIN